MKDMIKFSDRLRDMEAWRGLGWSCDIPVNVRSNAPAQTYK